MSTPTDWTQLVGKRCLVVETDAVPSPGDPLEVKVLELAPSRSFVKLWFHEESDGWFPTGKYSLIEELPPLGLPRSDGSRRIATAWWMSSAHVPFKIGYDDRTKSGAIQLVMDKWDDDPWGLVIGFDSNLQPIKEVVNGTGQKGRADFERQVAAWMEIFWPYTP